MHLKVVLYFFAGHHFHTNRARVRNLKGIAATVAGEVSDETSGCLDLFSFECI
jgi:hypothetical protein